MWNLLKAELLKLRRCQILWVGLVALALCPLVQYGSQLIVEAEYRNPNYDFSTLFENVVWGNTQMFFPISLVMIGSWLIDRESTHDTLKNIMTIPVSMPKMLGAKLFWVGIFAWKQDVWEDTLRRMGFFLGKFIYLLDAYDDVEEDIKNKN